MIVTLEFSNRLDEYDLSESAILYFALESYRHSLKQSEGEGLGYPEYFQRAHLIVDNLMCQLTEALLGIDQLKADTGRELTDIRLYADPRKGGSRS